jgi:hypothetical protein
MLPFDDRVEAAIPTVDQSQPLIQVAGTLRLAFKNSYKNPNMAIFGLFP